jgi:hypothetical protein
MSGFRAHRIEVALLTPVLRDLENLVHTGFYGLSVEDAARELLCGAVRRETYGDGMPPMTAPEVKQEG